MKKPSTSELSIRFLMEMVDNDYLFISGSTSGGSHSCFATRKFERIEANAEQTKLLRSRGSVYEYLTMVANGMKLPLKNKKVAWYETAHEINAAGRKLVEQNRAKIEAKLAKQKAEDSKSERLVIIRKFTSRESYFGIESKIAGLFRVTRQTGKRLYGEVIEKAVKDSWWSSYGFSHGGPGMRGATEVYVEAEHVVVDPATPEMYKAMLKAEAELMADLKEKEEAMTKEIAEIERRYRQRAIQSMAQTSDMMQEAGVPREVVEKYVDDQRAKAKIEDA